MKLASKVFMASLLPFLGIAVAYHYLSTSLFSNHLTELYRQEAGKELRQTEKDFLHFLTESETELRLMARSKFIDQTRPEQTRQNLNNFLYHDAAFTEISAITTNGREWLRASKYQDLRESNPPRQSLFYEPLYQKPLLQMEPYFAYSKNDPDFALPFLDLSVPLKNRQTGGVAGVLWLRIYSQPVQDILEDSLPAMGKIMLINSESGEVILQADDTRQDFSGSVKKIIERIKKSTMVNGWLEMESDRDTFLYRKFSYNGLGMTLVYFQPHQKIYFLADQLKTYNLRVAMLGIILFILASFILIRITISPLAGITAQIIELGRRYSREKDGTAQAEEQSANEIKLLQDSFSIFTTELSAYSDGLEAEIRARKETEEELREIQDQLEERIRERTLALEKTHAQLLHAEKLATSGSMAASIAHEFGNPLCGIKAVLTSVAQQEALPAGNARMVSMALDECARMNDLMQNLKDFNRPSSGEKTLTNLHLVIDDIVIFTRQNLARNNIEVEREYDPMLPPVMVVSDQIKQVFMNLINNSIDACKKGGVISIKTKAGEDSVVLSFGDNGQGIKQNDLPRVFDPFFTTKPVAMGTGLGLSVSYGIIRRHGGTITVTSKAGDGTTFTIILPTGKDKDEV